MRPPRSKLILDVEVLGMLAGQLRNGVLLPGPAAEDAGDLACLLLLQARGGER